MPEASHQPANSQHYDIVMVGGGMVGASLALMLAAASEREPATPLSILIVEPFPLPDEASLSHFQPSFDSRATALSYGSRQLLERMSVWPAITQHLCEIQRIHVSDRGHWGSTLMDCEQEGLPALGYVVENQWLGKVLLREVMQNPQIEFRCPAKVTSVTPNNQGVTIVLGESDTEQRISADLAVVADGARSGICQQLGIALNEQDYQQHALTTTLSFAQDHHLVAYERFTQQGPMALLPLQNDEQGQHRAALIWTLPVAEVEHWKHCTEEEFLAEIQQRFGYRLGRFRKVGQRVSYPLSLTQAAEQIRPGVVVMGNAAHALHPVAGQGFNLALRDAAGLTDTLMAAVRVGEPLGSLAVLQRYQQQQVVDQRNTIEFSDGLPRLFSIDHALIQAGRGIGLVGLDLLPQARSALVRLAAGLSTRRPRLGE